MPTTTPNRGYPLPVSTDAVNVPSDMQALGDAIDTDVDGILDLFNPGTWTPLLTATGSNPTYTVNTANLFNIGKLVIADFFITFITAGSGNYIVSTPFATQGNTGQRLGSATIGSGSTRYGRSLWENGTNQAAFGDESAGRITNSSPAAVSAGVQLSGTFLYFKA